MRMKPARQQWQTTRWPLIDAGMTRRDCLGWLRRHDYPEPPKSACIGCPFHSDRAWRGLRDGSPEEWADAVAVDAALREGDGRVDLSTAIAAEKTGRVARLVELDPGYCDVIVRRWQDWTGKAASLEADGEPFTRVGAERLGADNAEGAS